MLPPDPAGFHAVVSFTGHAYVLADVDRAELVRLGADGFGGANHPDVLRRLAGPAGHVGSLDVVLAAEARPGPSVDRRADLGEHPRVRRALAHRRDVEVYGDDAGLVVLGYGLVGRRELSVELFDPARRWRPRAAADRRRARPSRFGRAVLGAGGPGQRGVAAGVPRLWVRARRLGGADPADPESLASPG